MEIIKVFYEFDSFPAIASATEAADVQAFYLSTSNFGTTAVSYDNARVFAGMFRAKQGAFTAAGTYGLIDNGLSGVIDMTDGAGHGFLIATDNLFAQVQSSGTGAAQAVAFKIYYRWKNVGLAEYIGIVQSQQ